MSKYEKIKNNICKCFVWKEKKENTFSIKPNSISIEIDNIIYSIDINTICDTRTINIVSSKDVTVEKMYLLIGSIRRFEYLTQGSFYLLEQCNADTNDITDAIKEVELGYFYSITPFNSMHLFFQNIDYSTYFLKWYELEQELGIINQMFLFANNTNRFPADIRIAMCIECYEALFNYLRKKGVLPKISLRDKKSYKYCNKSNDITIKRSSLLAKYLSAIILKYGKTIFALEFNNIDSLIDKMVKTRNKVFHVDIYKKNILTGNQCAIYLLKLELLYRYIILQKIGINDTQLESAIKKRTEEININYIDYILI